jgi:hypothetical protein
MTGIWRILAGLILSSFDRSDSAVLSDLGCNDICIGGQLGCRSESLSVALDGAAVLTQYRHTFGRARATRLW